MQRTLESVPIPKSFPLDQMRKLAVASGELDFTRIPGAGVVLEDQLDRVIARLRAFHAPFKAVACLTPVLHPEPLPLRARIPFPQSTGEHRAATHDDRHLFRIDAAEFGHALYRR